MNPAIETATDPKFRFKTKFEKYTFSELVGIVSIPIGIAFVMSAIPYIRGSDSGTVYGWRLLAHLGPYHVPRVVENGEWRHSLATLRQAETLELIESEISQLLTNIEVVTQRRVAVRRIVKSDGFQIFLPVLTNLAAPPPAKTVRKGQSHFEANLRVAMDVVSATPAKDRRVPIHVIEAILTNNKDCWESELNEDVRRFREYRALLLLKLLQNEENLAEARESEVVKSFVASEAEHAGHVAYPTLPLMPLLYQFKTDHLGFEFVDISRRLHTLLGLEMMGDEKNVTRRSLKLEHKLDFVNFEKLVYLTICYSSLRVVPMISEYSLAVIARAASVIARGVAGAAILETVFRAEEHVIQSAPWYESGCGIASSACIAAVNVGVGAAVLRFMPFCGLPWILMRIRDSFTDCFRFV